jgi:predicted nucleic acid-binding Zn ribbon protein
MARYSKWQWTDELCDRCLAVYESSDDAVDLCPRCEARIHKWLKDTYGADEDI